MAERCQGQFYFQVTAGARAFFAIFAGRRHRDMGSRQRLSMSIAGTTWSIESSTFSSRHLPRRGRTLSWKKLQAEDADDHGLILPRPEVCSGVCQAAREHHEPEGAWIAAGRDHAAPERAGVHGNDRGLASGRTGVSDDVVRQEPHLVSPENDCIVGLCPPEHGQVLLVEPRLDGSGWRS